MICSVLFSVYLGRIRSEVLYTRHKSLTTVLLYFYRRRQYVGSCEGFVPYVQRWLQKYGYTNTAAVALSQGTKAQITLKKKRL
jgi:hypothetical protein